MARKIEHCIRCGKPIPVRSFRAYGPCDPRWCPVCGQDRWPKGYVGERRVQSSVLFLILGLAVLIAGLILYSTLSGRIRP